jgi:AbrB family looped-hinge helix DNA binding protein
MPIITELTRLVRPLRNGQITIPAEFRRALHLQEGVMLQITLAGDELRIRPVKLAEAGSGSDWLHELYLMFAPVRQQAAQITESQIDAEIAAALAELRSRKRPADPPVSAS